MRSVAWFYKYKGCTSKQIFFSREEAQKRAKSVTDKFKTPMKFYKCNFCEFFHLSRRK